jgi:hypothetical protein
MPIEGHRHQLISAVAASWLVALNKASRSCLALRQAESMPWTPYADWIFTVVSTGSILLIVWLVLRPRP